MADDVDFDQLLSDIGNIVDSPGNSKPKTPQKPPGNSVAARSLASAAAAAAVPSLASEPPSSHARSAERSSDIDDILADIGDILGGAPAPSSSTPPRPSAPAAAAARCTRPCLGPVDGPSDSRACSKLRCTKCDFAVARFEGFEWDAAVDYLFFRNNHPEGAKLKTCLKPSRGRAAYCCQCSWTTTSSSNVAAVGRDVRWVCAQH